VPNNSLGHHRKPIIQKVDIKPGSEGDATPTPASLLMAALFGHAAISELSLLSGIKRKLDFEPAKGSFCEGLRMPAP
jgi:hypothetical protein